MRFRTITLGLCFAVASCAGSRGVVPEGYDAYVVESHGMNGWSSGPGQRAVAEREADDYCKGQNKLVEITSETDNGPGGLGKVSSGEVHFHCVAPTQ